MPKNKKKIPAKLTPSILKKNDIKKENDVEKEIEEEEVGDESEEEIEEGQDEEEKEEEEEEVPEKLSSKSSPEEVKDEEEVDYLRQYQYKKVNNVPTIGGVLTDPDAGSKAAIMKRSLLVQKRINTLIPLDPGTDPKVLFSVTLNGYRLDLPTNKYIDVPLQVAEIVRNSNNQTVAALDQFKVGSNQDALR